MSARTSAVPLGKRWRFSRAPNKAPLLARVWLKNSARASTSAPQSVNPCRRIPTPSDWRSRGWCYRLLSHCPLFPLVAKTLLRRPDWLIISRRGGPRGRAGYDDALTRLSRTKETPLHLAVIFVAIVIAVGQVMSQFRAGSPSPIGLVARPHRRIVGGVTSHSPVQISCGKLSMRSRTRYQTQWKTRWARAQSEFLPSGLSLCSLDLLRWNGNVICRPLGVLRRGCDRMHDLGRVAVRIIAAANLAWISQTCAPMLNDKFLDAGSWSCGVSVVRNPSLAAAPSCAWASIANRQQELLVKRPWKVQLGSLTCSEILNLERNCRMTCREAADSARIRQ